MTSQTNQGILLDDRMLAYDFGQNHVMSTNRIFAAYHLLEEIYLNNPEIQFSRITPSEFDRKYLHMAHDQDYIKTIERLSEKGEGSAMEYGLGTPDCPVWTGMADISEVVVNSTLSITENLYNENINLGFGLLGGLHHATARKAAGFCYYNDINVAIHRLKDLDLTIKILYLDTDLHHGDGVQETFYHDPNILTISFHESGQFLFPGTGFPDEIGEDDGRGTSINLPFYPYTWDQAYQQAIEDIFPVLFESFDPDFVIWQAGSDAHIKDPLGHMMLTSNTYYFLGKFVRDQALQHMEVPKVLTLGGGGYNPYGNAKSWSNALAGLAGFQPPDRASEGWVEKCKEQGIDVRVSLTEPESAPISDDYEAIEKGNKEFREQLYDQVEPYFSF